MVQRHGRSTHDSLKAALHDNRWWPVVAFQGQLLLKQAHLWTILLLFSVLATLSSVQRWCATRDSSCVGRRKPMLSQRFHKITLLPLNCFMCINTILWQYFSYKICMLWKQKRTKGRSIPDKTYQDIKGGNADEDQGNGEFRYFWKEINNNKKINTFKNTNNNNNSTIKKEIKDILVALCWHSLNRTLKLF